MLSENDKITMVLLYAAHNHGVLVFLVGGQLRLWERFDRKHLWFLKK